MNCRCDWTEKIVGILVIVFAWWMTAYNQWILTALGIIMIWHAFRCGNMCTPTGPQKAMKKPVKKKKR